MMHDWCQEKLKQKTTNVFSHTIKPDSACCLKNTIIILVSKIVIVNIRNVLERQ